VGSIDARGDISVGVCSTGLILFGLLAGEIRGEEVVLSILVCPAIFVAYKTFFVQALEMFSVVPKLEGKQYKSVLGWVTYIVVSCKYQV